MRAFGREHTSSREGDSAAGTAPGKRTRTERLPIQAKARAGKVPEAAPAAFAPAPPITDDPFALHLLPVQGASLTSGDAAAVQSAAASGIAGPAGELPHAAAIQRSFGAALDVSSVSAHVGGAAADACAAMGAQAYATGSHVAFAAAPDLHTAAHETAHVVQQARGVNLYGGVGVAGDAYEQHADAVADRVVAGESVEALLRSGPSGSATQAIQRKAGADDHDAEAGEDEDDVDDAVFGGVVRKVTVDDAPLVSDASDPSATEVAKLTKTDRVTPLDLGVGEAFNKGKEGSGKSWWKVSVVSGPKSGSTGWVQVANLGSILKVTKAGKTAYKGKVGKGKVKIETGQALEKEGADDGDNNFALTYTGKDASEARWLQFIWREIVGIDDAGKSIPVKGSITTSGGTYDLTDNGTFAKPGTPGKSNYNTDCSDASDPFYEASGEADRSADSTKMIDLPGAAGAKAAEAFKDGAKKVVSRAHFTTFLVKGRKIKFKTHIDIKWDFLEEDDVYDPPAGKHTVSGSGAASKLPKTIAERFHEQYPAFKDIK